MSTIRLCNRAWKSGCNVQIQVGNGPTGTNPSIGVVNIAYNFHYPVQAGNANVNYRREADPDHPDGRFGLWVNVPNYGQDKDETV